MRAEHVNQLLEMRKHAPTTWRCTSNYYNIAAQYGISLEAEDRERDRFMDESLGLIPRAHDPTGTLTYAELRTILAALRMFQAVQHVLYVEGMQYFQDVKPLTGEEVNSLCKRLNGGEIVTITGGPEPSPKA